MKKLFLFCLFAICAHSLFSADYYWSAAGGGNWSSGANWAGPPGTPGAGDRAFFEGAGAGSTATVDVPVTVSEINISIDITLNISSALTVTGNLSAVTGTLTQGQSLTVNGTMTVNTAHDLILANVLNNFAGNVALTAVNNATLADANAVQLAGASNVSGNMSITSVGNITQAGGCALSVAGTTTLNSGGANDITLNLNNDFGGNLTITNANDVTLTDTGVIQFGGASTVTGNLAVTAGGNITEAGGSSLSVTGGSTFTVPNGSSIILDATNTFTGALAFYAASGTINSITVYDSNAIALPALTLAGSLDARVTGAGTITQTGALVITGTTTLRTGAASNITLNNANDFTGTVRIINGNNVSIIDSNAIQFGGASVVAGALSVTSGGAITQAGGSSLAITGTTSFNAGAANDITLDLANDFGGNVTITNANDVTLYDTGAIQLGGASTITGAFSVAGSGAITQAAGSSLSITGATTLNSGAANDITLNLANNFGGNVTVANANDVALADTGTIQFGGASIITGTFSVTSGGAITQAVGSSLAITGTTALNSGAAGDVTLNLANNFGGNVTITNANDVTLYDTGAIQLGGASTVTGNLAITANGNITEAPGSSLAVTGTSAFAVSNGSSIILDATNTLTGALAISPISGTINSITVYDSNAIDMPAVSLAGNLSLRVTGVGAITDCGNIAVTGTTTLQAQAGSNITFDNANDFTGDLTIVSGNNVTLVDTSSIRLGGASSVSGALSITAGGNITEAGGSSLIVNGASTFSVTNGSSVILDSSNTFTGALAFNAASGTINSITVVDSNTIDMPAVTLSGSLSLRITGAGSINDTGVLSITGATMLDAGAANNITLNNANNFTGDVRIVSGNNVTLVDANAIRFGGASDVSGALSVTSGGAITQAGGSSLSVTGAITLNAGAANDITLDLANDFGGNVTITSANDATLSDASALRFGGASNVTGNLYVTAGGSITEAGGSSLTVTGSLTFAVSNGSSIILDATNTLTGALDFSATSGSIDSITVYDSNAIDMPAVSLAGNLSLRVTGAGTITDAGALAVAGTTTLEAGAANDITLDNACNFTGDVRIVSGNDVTLVDTNAIRFGGASIVSGDFAVTTNGAITQAVGSSLAITGATTLDSGAASDITLNLANNFAGNLTIADANDVILSETGPFVFGGASNVTGSLSITAGGSITEAGGSSLSVTGGSAFAVTNGSSIILDSINTFSGALSFSATSGTISSITVHDSNAIDMPAVSISGSLSLRVTGAGDITDSGVVEVTGAATLDAGAANDIILDNNNDFAGNLTIVSGNNVTINDATAIRFGGASQISGNSAVTAVGNITQSPGSTLDVAGIASFGCGTNQITLENPLNGLAEVTITSAAMVTIVNNAAVDLATTSPLGSLAVNANPCTLKNSITVNGSLDCAGGTLDVDSANRQITLAGNWSCSGIFNARAGRVVFDGGGVSDLDSGAAGVTDTGHDFYDVLVTANTTVNLVNSPVCVGNALSIDGDNDRFDINGLDFTIDTLDFTSNEGMLELHGTQAIQTVTNPDLSHGITLYSFSASLPADGQVRLFEFSTLEFAGGARTHTLTGNIEVYNDLVLSSGRLSALSFTISLHGDFDSTGGGLFVYGASTVDFIGTGAQLEQHVTGINTFYYFNCTLSSKTIRFGAGSTTTIPSGGTFRVIGQAAPANWIHLRSTADGTYWNFTLSGGATLYLQYVFVHDSYATDYIVTPPDVDVSDHCDRWITTLSITEKITQDSDGNGKIERIRVQAAANLNDNFGGLSLLISSGGYSIDTGKGLNGVSTGSDPSSPAGGEMHDRYFYIWLVEKPCLDTWSTPGFRIPDNTTLKDLSFPVPATLEFGATIHVPTDRANPLVGYTLAAAGRNQVFVHFSENLPVTEASFSFDFGSGGLQPSTLASIATGEYLLTFTGNNVSVSSVVNLAQLSITGVADTAGNNLEGVVGIVDHRVSDIAIGITGSEAARPVLAFYANPDERHWDPVRGGVGSILLFDGFAWLQDKDITLQADLHAAVSGEDIKLFFDSNVTGSLVSNGLWLPQGSMTMGFVPQDNTVPPANQAAQSVPGTPPERREYSLVSANPDVYQGAKLDFFFRFSTGIYGARLSKPLASDWYRSVRPWSFLVREPQGRKGKVDIFHNVVNPVLGEKVKIYYVLEKDGPVTITLFDLAGSIVCVLYRGSQCKGEHSTAWDGRNRGSKIVASGVYFVRIVGPDLDETRKILIVK